MSQSIVAERGAHRPREFWIRLVRRWEASETSQQAIADIAGVNVHTLRYWAAKLRAETQPVQARPEHSDFVEVAGLRAAARSGAVACRIHVGERLVVELSVLPPVEWLRALSKEG